MRKVTKICTRCKRRKYLKLFDRKSTASDGRKSWCKVCVAKHQKKVWSAYKRDKDHGSLSATPQKFLKHWLCNVKRSGRHPLSPHLTLNYLMTLWNKQKGRCSITNVPMTHIKGRGKVDTNVSVDRIDSNIKKYEKGNLQLVCYRVNMMKSNMKTDNFLNWCGKISQKT